MNNVFKKYLYIHLEAIVRARRDKKMGPLQIVFQFMMTYIKTFNEVLPLI